MKIEKLTLKANDRVMTLNGKIATVIPKNNSEDSELYLHLNRHFVSTSHIQLDNVFIDLFELAKDDVLNVDDWDEIFKPINNHFVKDDSIFHFETYGEELKFVRSHDNKNIWTLVDDSNGNLYVVPGFHLVNRVHYFVTEKPWKSEHFSVLYHEDNMCDKMNFKTPKEGFNLLLERYHKNDVCKNEFADSIYNDRETEFHEDIPLEIIVQAIQLLRQHNHDENVHEVEIEADYEAGFEKDGTKEFNLCEDYNFENGKKVPVGTRIGVEKQNLISKKIELSLDVGIFPF